MARHRRTQNKSGAIRLPSSSEARAQSIAASLAPIAMQVLTDVVADEAASPADRFTAAQGLLNHALGRASSDVVMITPPTPPEWQAIEREIILQNLADGDRLSHARTEREKRLAAQEAYLDEIETPRGRFNDTRNDANSDEGASA